MTDHDPPTAPARRADPLQVEHRWGGARLWVSLTAGTVLWLTHVSGMAALTPYSCTIDSTVWLHTLSVVTLAGTLASIVVPWRHWRTPSEDASGLRFVGGVGVLLNSLLAFAIVAEWLPVFLIEVCAR